MVDGGCWWMVMMSDGWWCCWDGRWCRHDERRGREDGGWRVVPHYSYTETTLLKCSPGSTRMSPLTTGSREQVNNSLKLRVTEKSSLRSAGRFIYWSAETKVLKAQNLVFKSTNGENCASEALGSTFLKQMILGVKLKHSSKEFPKKHASQRVSRHCSWRSSSIWLMSSGDPLLSPDNCWRRFCICSRTVLKCSAEGIAACLRRIQARHASPAATSE